MLANIAIFTNAIRDMVVTIHRLNRFKLYGNITSFLTVAFELKIITIETPI